MWIVDILHEEIESYKEEASKETGKSAFVVAKTGTLFKNPYSWTVVG